MKTNMRKTAIVTTFTAALIGLCATAQAGGFAEESSTGMGASHRAERVVTYTDLDLTAEQGREALTHRVNRAAQNVCGPTDHRLAGSLRAAARNRDCAREAYDNAIARIESETALAARN